MSDMKQKIRLLFLMQSCGIGGAEVQAVNLINGLSKNIFEISVVYLRNETDLLKKINLDAIENRAFCLHAGRAIDLGAIRRLASYTEKMKIDIVFCTNMYPLFYAWCTRLYSRRVPKIIEAFHSTKFGTWKDRLKMIAYYPICWASDALIFVCKNQKRFWNKRLLTARKTEIIYNGADAKFFVNDFTATQLSNFRGSYGMSATDYIIGICAFMRPEKYHVDLVRAIAKARADGLSVRALFIGDGPEREELERIICGLGLGSEIRITGLLDDVRLAVSACDVIAITSHYVETFSISALEAMLLCKPMIMSDIGGANEQVEHGSTGFLYKAGDLLKLSEHVASLADPHLRINMGKQARERVLNMYTLSSMVNSYSRLLQSVLASDGVNNDDY